MLKINQSQERKYGKIIRYLGNIRDKNFEQEYLMMHLIREISLMGDSLKKFYKNIYPLILDLCIGN